MCLILCIKISIKDVIHTPKQKISFNMCLFQKNRSSQYFHHFVMSVLEVDFSSLLTLSSSSFIIVSIFDNRCRLFVRSNVREKQNPSESSNSFVSSSVILFSSLSPTFGFGCFFVAILTCVKIVLMNNKDRQISWIDPVKW